MGESGDDPFMDKIAKPLGGKKWAEKGNLEMPGTEFTKFTVLSGAWARPPALNAFVTVFG